MIPTLRSQFAKRLHPFAANNALKMATRGVSTQFNRGVSKLANNNVNVNNNSSSAFPTGSFNGLPFNNVNMRAYARLRYAVTDDEADSQAALLDPLLQAQKQQAQKQQEQVKHDFSDLILGRIEEPKDTIKSAMEEKMRLKEERDRFIRQKRTQIYVSRMAHRFEDHLAAEAQTNKQADLEQRAIQEAVQRYNKIIKGATQRKKGAALAPSQRVLVEWYQPLVEAIRAEQNDIRKDVPGEDRHNYGPYLLKLSPEKLAVITMHEILGQLLIDNNLKFTSASISLGRAVQAEINYEKIRRIPGAWNSLIKSAMPQPTVHKINIHAKRMLDDADWDDAVCCRVGAILISLLLKHAHIPTPPNNLLKGLEKTPAFEHEIVIQRGKRVGYLRAHKDLLTIIDDGHSIRSVLHPRHLPMIIPPKPWTAPREGGYVTISELMMRTREGSKLQADLLKYGDMPQIFDGLNTLNETSWAINKKVFAVMEEVWNSGGGIAALPPRKDIDLPEKPPADADFKTMSEYKKLLKKVTQENRDLHSLRCDTSHKLQVARDFIDSNFYFPHNIDFRGRAYPIPPHLNHLGSDICRGLLTFGKGLPLGSNGLYWLKIHLANLYGMDKFDFNARINFVDDNKDNILDSARDPLGGNRWWLAAEDPWQCLAACFELAAAWDSPNPEEYVCSLPVQMDGSCNGLQHYAALGRDEIGGLHVNLLPSDRPMDVYLGVRDVVINHIERDAKAGDPYAQALLGRVERSTIKQTVMTSVYGVTMIGARKQIHKRLKEKKAVPEDMVYKCSFYLAKTVFRSLGEVFSGAKNIMAWLNECAALISADTMPVMWVTPLGLPVMQPYRNANNSYQVKTVMQIVTLVDCSDKLPVSVQKQKSAFPPNYVHSLDASHMLMTASACKKEGLTFAAVHDSYWTHAAKVSRMNEIIREQFIELHSQPLLETLLMSFKERHPNIDFPPIPERGTLDLRRVKDALYFFD